MSDRFGRFKHVPPACVRVLPRWPVRQIRSSLTPCSIKGSSEAAPRNIHCNKDREREGPGEERGTYLWSWSSWISWQPWNTQFALWARKIRTQSNIGSVCISVNNHFGFIYKVLFTWTYIYCRVTMVVCNGYCIAETILCTISLDPQSISSSPPILGQANVKPICFVYTLVLLDVGGTWKEETGSLHVPLLKIELPRDTPKWFWFPTT